MKENINNDKNRIGKIFDFLYYLLVALISAICISIIFQQLTNKNKIPDILGYKLFMINKDFMDETLNEGDLVFTKNVDTKILKVGDIVAFRNSQNLVTIHEILEIKDENEKNRFIMQTLENEVSYNKYVSDSRIEGILVLKIPMLGKIILFLIEPITLIVIIAIILIVGYVFYLKAKKAE